MVTNSCPNHDFELSLLPQNTRFLLGIDEVGRGPLAGPLTVGGFLLDLNIFSSAEFTEYKVRDSKKLSPHQRQIIHQYFVDNKYIFKTFSSSSVEIDKFGISVCLSNLISKILKHFSGQFDYCLIDGSPISRLLVQSNNFDELSTWATTLTARKNLLRGRLGFAVKGDAQCFSIASASIVAKVDHDQQMAKYDQLYPQYNFAKNQGYGTKQHLQALKTHGPCPIHRLSFHPISCLQK